MKREQKAILENHVKWLKDKKSGKCADLRNADLSNADLSYANLWKADLWNADSLFGEEKLAITPMQIAGYKYYILIAGSYMKIGCEVHKISEWKKYRKIRIQKMDSEAWEWWQEHKPLIMPIAEHHLNKHKYALPAPTKEQELKEQQDAIEGIVI